MLNHFDNNNNNNTNDNIYGAVIVAKATARWHFDVTFVKPDKGCGV